MFSSSHGQDGRGCRCRGLMKTLRCCRVRTILVFTMLLAVGAQVVINEFRPSTNPDLPNQEAISVQPVFTHMLQDAGGGNNTKVFRPESVRRQVTIVTAYFDVPSKHLRGEYIHWIQNILSLREAIIIFTTPDMVGELTRLRHHDKGLTRIVTMTLEDTWIARQQTHIYWENQINIDPESAIHRSYTLFWIWLSKTWFVTEVVKTNPFGSTYFVWSDIGCFRNTKYNDRVWIQHLEMVPNEAMLLMASQAPHASDTMWVQKRDNPRMYVAGAQMAGRKPTWLKFDALFRETVRGYMNRGLFIGEDQALIQSTCMRNPSICAFVPPDAASGDVWFGLQDVLHSRGKVFYRDNPLLFWLPPLKRGVLCTLLKDEPVDVVKTWADHHTRAGFDVVIYDHGSSVVPELPEGRIRQFPDSAPYCAAKDVSQRCVLMRQCREWEQSARTHAHGFAICQQAAYMDCLHVYGDAYEWIGNWDVDEYVFKTNTQSVTVHRPNTPERLTPQGRHNNDLLLTWVNKISGNGLKLWLSTFRAHNSRASVVVLAPQRMSAAQEAELDRLQRMFRIHAVRYEGPKEIKDRHALWLEHLQRYPNYTRVIASDSFDVYFQRDPFVACRFSPLEACEAYVGEEDDRFKYADDNPINERHCLGEAKTEALMHHHMVNNGFMWGSRRGMLAVLGALSSRLQDDRCLDQVILNHIARSGELERDSPGCRLRVEPSHNTCVKVLGIAYHVYHDTPMTWAHSSKPRTILGQAGNDSSEVAAVHMYDDHPEHLKWTRYLPQAADEHVTQEGESNFWTIAESMGDSLQFQCLKFGPRRDDRSTFAGDPSHHLWRAPYPHLGDIVKCHDATCENIGSEKMLSRTRAVAAIDVHRHILHSGHVVTPWSQVDRRQLRCHHYAYRSKEYVSEKSNKNSNPFLMKQMSAKVFDRNGWFNSVKDSHYVVSRPLPVVCVAFLSCKRLDKLKRAHAAMSEYAHAQPSIRFVFAIVDNGSDEDTQQWIRAQPSFEHATLLATNVGIARAMGMLWASCGDAPYILNIEDDWIVNSGLPADVLRESMRLLDAHKDVLEVWLRTHDQGFQFRPGATTSINGHVQRSLPRQGTPLAYYLASSTKAVFPWWGQYTNGASLKHAGRLQQLGPMHQTECSDRGNCESEFTARVAYVGMKAARLCWRGDFCDNTWDNEPENKVLFRHLGGARSPGHAESSGLGI